MLCTLDELKTYLGVSGSTDDDWITQQAQIISDVIENYCGRKFLQANYAQTYYKEDFYDNGFLIVDRLEAFHYPVKEVTLLEDNGEDILPNIRVQKNMGFIIDPTGFFRYTGPILAEYTAGYTVDKIPSAIKQVLFALVQERYSKKQAGVALSFGSDVQRVSIPGTISIDFDYSLDTNQRSASFGTILGSYTNSLDQFRSERVIVGSGRITFVEEA